MKATGLILCLLYFFETFSMSEGGHYWEAGRRYAYFTRGRILSKVSESSTSFLGMEFEYTMEICLIGPNRIQMTSGNYSLVEVSDELINEWRVKPLGLTGQNPIELSWAIEQTLMSPIQVKLNRGQIQSVYIERELPAWAGELKRRQVSQFWFTLDGAGSPSNGIRGGQSEPQQSFSTTETSSFGECEATFGVNRVEHAQQEGEALLENYDIFQMRPFPAMCQTKERSVYEITRKINRTECERMPMKTSLAHPLLSLSPHLEEHSLDYSDDEGNVVSRFRAWGNLRQNSLILYQIQHEVDCGNEATAQSPASFENITLVSIEPIDSFSVASLTDPINVWNLESDSLRFPQSRVSTQKKVVVAHMVNTPGAVRWALSQGANGIEIDLRFDNNQPAFFQHSAGLLEPCDCTCICPFSGYDCPESSVCHALWKETGSHCGARSGVQEMFEFLGERDISGQLAVIYIDSKLDSKMRDYWGAGSNLVQLMNRLLFDRGYRGQVLISGSETKYLDYLRGALEAARNSKHEDKYFYTFDAEGMDGEKVYYFLSQLGTNNIFYSTGITICLPVVYYDAVRKSIELGVYAGVGIWSLDKETSMEKYKAVGVSAIVTNQPQLAVSVFGYQDLAAPGEALLSKTVPAPRDSNWACDCNYHKCGCTISLSAPPNHACKCEYVPLWRCEGATVSCSDGKSPCCKNPKPFKEDCQFGNGDCGGY